MTTLAVWYVTLQRYLWYQRFILEIIRDGFVLITFLLIIDWLKILFLLTSWIIALLASNVDAHGLQTTACFVLFFGRFVFIIFCRFSWLISFIDGPYSNTTVCVDHSFVQIQLLNEFGLLCFSVNFFRFSFLLYRRCINGLVILTIIKLKVIYNVVYQLIPFGFSFALKHHRALVALYC